MSAARDEKETFLGRWSRLKREEEKKAAVPEKKEAEAAKPEAPPLPPVETLTPTSDFTPFMHPKVQDAVRRVALKKLFSDPHFNVIDPNEPFSGDWTVAEPIGPDLMKQLNQARLHLLSDEERKKVEEAEAQAAAAAQEPTHATGPVPEEDKKPDEPGRKDA